MKFTSILASSAIFAAVGSAVDAADYPEYQDQIRLASRRPDGDFDGFREPVDEQPEEYRPSRDLISNLKGFHEAAIAKHLEPYHPRPRDGPIGRQMVSGMARDYTNMLAARNSPEHRMRGSRSDPFERPRDMPQNTKSVRDRAAWHMEQQRRHMAGPRVTHRRSRPQAAEPNFELAPEEPEMQMD